MPLPVELVAAQERMARAQEALLNFLQDSDHDSGTHRGLLEEVQKTGREYETVIAATLGDGS